VYTEESIRYVNGTGKRSFSFLSHLDSVGAYLELLCDIEVFPLPLELTALIEIDGEEAAIWPSSRSVFQRHTPHLHSYDFFFLNKVVLLLLSQLELFLAVPHHYPLHVVSSLCLLYSEWLHQHPDSFIKQILFPKVAFGARLEPFYADPMPE